MKRPSPNTIWFAEAPTIGSRLSSWLSHVHPCAAAHNIGISANKANPCQSSLGRLMHKVLFVALHCNEHHSANVRS